VVLIYLVLPNIISLIWYCIEILERGRVRVPPSIFTGIEIKSKICNRLPLSWLFGFVVGDTQRDLTFLRGGDVKPVLRKRNRRYGGPIKFTSGNAVRHGTPVWVLLSEVKRHSTLFSAASRGLILRKKQNFAYGTLLIGLSTLREEKNDPLHYLWKLTFQCFWFSSLRKVITEVKQKWPSPFWRTRKMVHFACKNIFQDVGSTSLQFYIGRWKCL